MRNAALVDLTSKVAHLPCARPIGRVRSLDGHLVEICGLEMDVKLGDRLQLTRHDGTSLTGEVLRIDEDAVAMLPDEPPHQVALSDRVFSLGPTTISPSNAWLGRVIDPYGAPLDGRPLRAGANDVAIRNDPPAAVSRKPLGPRLETGFHLFNTLLPLVRGQRIGVFAGSGVGKSTLLADLIKRIEADVIVLALVGERGREVRDFTQKVLGVDGMKRTVVVAATADAAATTRLHCPETAMRVAEHFRDQGLHAALFVDSITRFAEAHREAAIASGEFPGLRGFPASTPPKLTRLVERAGPGAVGTGDITAVFTVLVAGSDMEEPVADMMRGVLDGHFVLDRSLAERGWFPSVNVLKSLSRSLPEAAREDEITLIAKARANLSVYDASEALVRAGLYSEGTDPQLDQAIAFHAMFEEFAQTRDAKSISASFEALSLALRRAGVLAA